LWVQYYKVIAVKCITVGVFNTTGFPAVAVIDLIQVIKVGADFHLNEYTTVVKLRNGFSI